MRIHTLILALMTGAAVSNVTHAALFDRGSGLIYDDILDVTWLQNANLAATETFGVSGINANGSMNWDTAQSWIEAMNAAEYLGYNDWRLPETGPVNGIAFQYASTVNGTADYGFNITSPNSELSHMYYVSLGLKGYVSTSGAYQADFGVFGNGTANGVDQSSFGQEDIGLVQNLQAYSYWSGTEYEPDPNQAWHLITYFGGQDAHAKANSYFAWAVRSGDLTVPDINVTAVPEPESYALLLAGLGFVGYAARRKSRRVAAQ